MIIPAGSWNGPARLPTPRPQAPLSLAGTQSPLPPPRLMRGQMDEAPAAPAGPSWTPDPVPAPAPTVVAMPRPGEVGVAQAPQAWTTSLARLEELGMGTFQFQEQSQGWVLICQMRTAQPGTKQRITTRPTATRAEAARLALAEA